MKLKVIEQERQYLYFQRIKLTQYINFFTVNSWLIYLRAWSNKS